MEELNGHNGGGIAPGMSLRNAARGQAITRQDVYVLSPDQLVIDPENVRDSYDSEQARENIESLKSAMRAGRSIPILEIVTQADDNGRYMIVDGAHRKLAADELQKEGILYKLRCVGFKGNPTDRIAYMMRSEGLPLNPVEMARGVLKLSNRNMSEKEIAQSLDKSHAWVRNQLLLAQADPEVHQMIRERKVSASNVLEMIREYPNNYAAKLAALAGEVQKAGKKKVTKAVMSGPRVPPKTVDVLVHSIRGMCEELGDRVLQKVSDAEARIKSQELSKEDMRNETVEVSIAALMQIVKGSDALREFEERCAVREARRAEKRALAEARQQASQQASLLEEQEEAGQVSTVFTTDSIEVSCDDADEGSAHHDTDEGQDAIDQQETFGFPFVDHHDRVMPMMAAALTGN